MKGTVKGIVDNKNFGFIVSESMVRGEKEFFFHRDDFAGHWNDLVEDVKGGYKVPVEFEKVESNRGPRAANIRRTDHPNAAA
jgi:cold shock CspA family protein